MKTGTRAWSGLISTPAFLFDHTTSPELIAERCQLLRYQACSAMFQFFWQFATGASWLTWDIDIYKWRCCPTAGKGERLLLILNRPYFEWKVWTVQEENYGRQCKEPPSILRNEFLSLLWSSNRIGLVWSRETHKEKQTNTVAKWAQVKQWTLMTYWSLEWGLGQDSSTLLQT